MYARAVEDAAGRLHELETTTRADLALAALAFGLAVAATRSWPTLAMPLFLGGAGVGVLGMRALVRHWDLLDRLADERAAYVIPAVRAYAAREASMARRRSLACQLRAVLDQSRLGVELTSIGATDELEALACLLADDRLVLDPLSAVACKRLLGDSPDSPLFEPETRSAELRARVREIELGFGPRQFE